MTRKRNEKTKSIQALKSSVTEILITDNGELKPFIQTFHYEPENITLQSLGSILGIFEIEDRSEDSAYIVNFLSSIVKKEYFARPKRSPIESLEATLHKINLALSELIKHDNTQWLGKLNAAICVLEKNNLHFSVSGQSKTFLIRNGMLTDISEGLSEESNLHPLKTFTDVSSGRLKNDDKIILTTPDIFELFPLAEIQKNAQKFEKEKFAQFMKTALVNHLAFGSTIIIDIFEAESPKPAIVKNNKPSKLEVDFSLPPNVFSQQAFKHPKTRNTNKDTQNKISNPDTHNSLIDENSKDHYTDSKTGHIYVQGTIPDEYNESLLSDALQKTQEIASNALYEIQRSTKAIIKNITNSFQKRAVQRKTSAPQSVAQHKKTSETPYTPQSQHIPINNNPNQITYTQESQQLKENSFVSKLSQAAKSTQIFVKDKVSFVHEIDSSASFSRAKSFLISLTTALKPIINTSRIYIEKMLSRTSSKTQRIYKNLDSKQKKYALLILFLVFVVPFFLSKIGSSDQKNNQETPTAPQNTGVIKPLSQDKNVRTITSTQEILKNNSITELLLLKKSAFAVTKDAVVVLENIDKPVSYAIPPEYGRAIKATSMQDINTLFIFTDTHKFISFTPSNHRFSENNINIENPDHIQSIATYLTYLYILDDQSKTIYRYPRSDGGFGEKTSWLKENTSISDKTSMAISEDLYLSNPDNIVAFNRGKKASITFETSKTPVIFSKIFAQPDTKYLYALDTTNKRIVQFDKTTGSITNQYTHENIVNAKTIAINEEGGQAFVVTDSELFSFSIE